MKRDPMRSRAAISMTACAALMAVSFGTDISDAQAIEQIEKYCQASWRNARLSQHHWDDCTQQVFVELLESVSTDGLAEAISDADSHERRELNRAIWRTTKRRHRARQAHSLSEWDPADERNEGRHESAADQWQQVLHQAGSQLSNRQRQILERAANGDSISDIAADFDLTPARASDEKYKALRKLRQYVGGVA